MALLKIRGLYLCDMFVGISNIDVITYFSKFIQFSYFGSTYYYENIVLCKKKPIPWIFVCRYFGCIKVLNKVTLDN